MHSLLLECRPHIARTSNRIYAMCTWRGVLFEFSNNYSNDVYLKKINWTIFRTGKESNLIVNWREYVYSFDNEKQNAKRLTC